MVFKGNITGAGFGKVTSLPTLATPVMSPAGATYSFYITVANRTLGTTLGFNRGSGVGSVAASDDHLEIGEGYGMAYPFGSYTTDIRWNGESCFMFATLVIASSTQTFIGNVYYSIMTASPTIKPSSRPTTSRPSSIPTTSRPTFQLTGTPKPSNQPTPKPSNQPTPQPSNQPTPQPQIPPTSTPTLQFTVSPPGVPTGNPTINPTPRVTLSRSPRPSRSPSSKPSPSLSPTKSYKTEILDRLFPKKPNEPTRPSSSARKDISAISSVLLFFVYIVT